MLWIITKVLYQSIHVPVSFYNEENRYTKLIFSLTFNKMYPKRKKHSESFYIIVAVDLISLSFSNQGKQILYQIRFLSVSFS